ncbi:hypothetical protein, partial [Flexistipes sp.]|uniref:hypothetical protein n=1 Tax=Flexistipes sp. TaxID=3088135 RepID=UPI002E1CE06B|nr:hypothetical protein [Flexistipes sp.]
LIPKGISSSNKNVYINIGVVLLLFFSLFVVVRNYYYDEKIYNDIKLVKQFGVTDNFIQNVNEMEEKNKFIYSYANKDLVYYATYNKDDDIAKMLEENVQDALKFQKSHLTYYSKAWNMIYSTDNFLSDYDGIVDTIKKGIDLKPDYEKLWTLLHYVNMKKASEVTGKPIENFLLSEEDRKNLLDKMQKTMEAIKEGKK